MNLTLVCINYYDEHVSFKQRKFVRDGVSEGDATYKNFRIWLDDISPTEEMWDRIMSDDEKYDYSSTDVVDNVPPVQSEVDIYASSSLPTGDEDFDGSDHNGEDQN